MKPKKAILPILLIVLFAFGAVFGIRVYEKHSYPREYEEYVTKYCAEYSVPEPLVYAVIRTESSFNPEARSGVGAMGLMQLMPDTYDWLGRLMGEEAPEDMIYDPEQNLQFGIYYLRHLYDRFGDWETALAGYNAGHGRVEGWLSDESYSTDGVTLDYIPIEETNNYVNRVVSVRNTYERLYYTED